MRILTAIKLLSALLVLFMPAVAQGQGEGRLFVKSIEVQGLKTMQEEELLYLIGLEAGQYSSAEQVTEGIKRAFLKGIFNGLSVDENDGKFLLRVDERWVLERINVKSDVFQSSDVISILDLEKGGHITSEMLNDAAKTLENNIRGKGYPDCRVSYSAVPQETGNLIDLDVEIIEGPPKLIERIVIIGRPKEEVTQRMRLKEGKTFDTHLLKEDLITLRDYYIKRGFINPEIGPSEFLDGELVLRINPGKRLDYIIKGNSLFLDKVIIDIMPFLDEGEINDDLLSEGIERVIEMYRSKGYSDIQVAPVVKSTRDFIEVRVYINEGSIKTVRSFKVIKNGKVSKEGVVNIVNNRKGRNFQPFRLEDDARIIKEFYSALGYKDVAVSEPRTIVKNNDVDIEIDVNTGRLFTIRDVLITGNDYLPLVFIRENIDIKAGAPYNDVDILTSRRKLQAACRGQGFYDCTVQAHRELGQENVLVTFEVREGEKFFFGKIIISGNRLIHTDTIKRHIRISEGDSLDPALIIQSRQRLLGLGLFSKVEAEIIWNRGNKADVHIDVRESVPGKVDFGIGYGDYEGFRTFIEIGYGNLFGDASLGSLRLEASTLWRRYILNYTRPYLFGKDIRSLTFLLREERKQKNIDTGEISYRVMKNSASTGLEKDLGKKVSASLYYEYSIVDTFDVKPDIVLSKEDAGRVAISSLSPSIYYNTLNDQFDPTRGVLVGINIKEASEFLLSEAEFMKTTLKASAYYRASGRIVTAISLGGGIAEAHGSTISLPIIERFYMGGRNTVRGYDQDSIGPVGVNGLPIGGNYFLLGNLEFRVRLAGSWRAVAFGDCGNVWIERSDVSTGDLRCSAGAGIRYKTPVGPLRLDYGYKIDRRVDESVGELHFSIGHAF